MDNLIQFFGRLHPLLVHLPIGILLLAVCLHFLGRWPKYARFNELMPVLWFAGAITSVLACLAGFLLKLGGDYEEAAVEVHQYLGIGLAVITVVIFLARSRALSKRLQTPAVLLIAILLAATGHFGGNLTHGEGYLTQPIYALIGKTPGKAVRQPITNVQEALVYQDLVEPVLEQKCWQCHSVKKQKGKLRLDTKEFLLKGGEHGEILAAGNANKSDLYTRLLLPEQDDDRMPPKGKPQLTEAEIKLIGWWITEGKGDFTKKVADVPKDSEISEIITSLNSRAIEEKTVSEMPAIKVTAARPTDIQKLQRLGVVLTPLEKGSFFLTANLVNAAHFTDAQMPLLASLKDQLVWLDMSETKITDEGVQQLSQFKNLTRLSLDNTAVTDNGLAGLQDLKHLQYLNLYGTHVTDAGLKTLQGCKNLKALYLWQTGVTAQGVATLQKIRGTNMEINFGVGADSINTL